MGAERARLALLVATMTLGWAAFGSTASAWCQMTSSSRRPTEEEPCVIATPPETFPLAWRRRCTSMSLSTHGSRDLPFAQVRSILQGAIATWQGVQCGSASVGLRIELLEDLNECERASHFTQNANVHSLLFVGSGWVDERMHDARAYAVTLVWHDPRSGEIWDVDMEVNEGRGPYGICPSSGCPEGLVDLPNVMTHEMGHYFGLAHTPDDPLATMWASADADETFKRDLREDDVLGICSVYPPGSLAEECNFTPRGGLNLDCVRSDGCGCATPGAPSTSRRGALVACVAMLVLGWMARRRSRR